MLDLVEGSNDGISLEVFFFIDTLGVQRSIPLEGLMSFLMPINSLAAM